MEIIFVSIIFWLLAIIAVEAITEIILTGDIFAWFRRFIHSTDSWFLQSLFTCGLCLSVWVSASIAWALPFKFDNIWLSIIIKTFALHRLSNVFHELCKRWFDRIPKAINIIKTEPISEEMFDLGEDDA